MTATPMQRIKESMAIAQRRIVRRLSNDRVEAMRFDAPLLPRDVWAQHRVFATTVIRGAENHEMTGYLVEIDWTTSEIVAHVPLPTGADDSVFWNPRGGNRGGRGIVCHDNKLYVATACTVLVYDADLTQIGEVSHPWMAGLHEIAVDDEGIWVTATVHDLVLKVDFNGNEIDAWWANDCATMCDLLDYDRRELNLDLQFPADDFAAAYDRYCKEEVLHLNSVCEHAGALYALACRRNAMLRLTPDPTVIVRDDELGSPHNCAITPDGRVVVNDTRNQCVRVYELAGGRRLKTIHTDVTGADGAGQQFAKRGWQRGLWHVKDSVFLVGTSPATLFELDIDRPVVGRAVEIDSDVRHCIHGLVATTQLTR